MPSTSDQAGKSVHYTSPVNDAIPIVVHQTDDGGGTNANINALASQKTAPVSQTQGNAPSAGDVVSFGYVRPAAVVNKQLGGTGTNIPSLIFSNPA